MATKKKQSKTQQANVAKPAKSKTRTRAALTSSRAPAAKRSQVAKRAGARPANAAKVVTRTEAVKRAKVVKRDSPVKRRPPAMFQRIAFTMVSIEDAKRARAFYEDVLGFKRGLASPDGVWTEYDLPGGGCVALFRHPEPGFARAPGGGTSVAFEVADLDALNERLRAAGVSYVGDMMHGPRCRMSNIVDSEGNSIILHQLALEKS